MKRKFDKNTARELFYDWRELYPDSKVDLSAISDDCVGNVVESLNDDAGSYHYSDSQVKDALWIFLNQEIDSLLENLEERFLEKPRERLLGEPEVDVREEQRLAKGDIAYDEEQDRRGD